MRTKEEVTFAFTPVGKLDPVAQNKLLKIEVAFRDLATDVADLVPESADRTAALRKLLESKMTCVQAISHAQVNKPVGTEKEKSNEKEDGKQSGKQGGKPKDDGKGK